MTVSRINLFPPSAPASPSDARSTALRRPPPRRAERLGTVASSAGMRTPQQRATSQLGSRSAPRPHPSRPRSAPMARHGQRRVPSLGQLPSAASASSALWPPPRHQPHRAGGSFTVSERDKHAALHADLAEGDVVVTVEHCTDCEAHKDYTRHSEAR